MHFDPDVAVKALSTLASLLSITSSTLKLSESGLSKVDAVKKYKSEASKEEREILDEPAVVETVLAMMIIPRVLLRQLEVEARSCVVQHVKDRKKAGSSLSGKEQADIHAAQCVCKVLRDAKRYNKGVIPGPVLSDLWDVYGCRD